MSRDVDPVLRAIDDWRERGLVDERLAELLRADARAHARERGRVQLQYALGATAGAILLLAAGAFIARNWNTLTVPWRCTVLGGVGVGLIVGARSLERRLRLEPVGLLLRASGLGLLMTAYVYSDRAWDAGTLQAMVIGVLALATPLVSLLAGVARRPGPTALNTVAAYGFLAVFLDRIGVDADAIVWILDGVLLLSLAFLVQRLRTSGDGAAIERTLVAFVVSLFGGLVLVWITAAGPLGAEDDAVWGLDGWLALTVAVLLWGMHRAPPRLFRPWYGRLLAACVLIAIPLGFWTCHELGLDWRWTGVGPGLVGALGLAYGLRHSKGVVVASCVALIAAAIAIADFGNRSAISIVLILSAAAAALFWLAARLARPDGEAEGPQ